MSNVEIGRHAALMMIRGLRGLVGADDKQFVFILGAMSENASEGAEHAEIERRPVEVIDTLRGMRDMFESEYRHSGGVVGDNPLPPTRKLLKGK